MDRNTFATLPKSVWAVLGATLVMGVVWGCSSKSGGPEEQVPEATANARAQALEAFATCASGLNVTFEAKAAALSTAVVALRDSNGDAATLETARQAFKDAMFAWQTLEVMRFGPMANPSTTAGQDIRYNIYSWPLPSRCTVEEQIVSQGYNAANFKDSLANRRGLTALEYLLFFEGDETACPNSSSIVSSGSWAALSAEDRASRKRAYAAVVAQDVDDRAKQLIAAWADGFENTLRTAGQSGNAVFRTTQSALNTISDGLLYVDSDIKDSKLAIPVGIRDCATDTCPEALESQYAGLSKENLRANLIGSRYLIEGCGENFSGPAFDDLLIAVNASETAESLVIRIQEAQEALDAIEEPDLAPALSADLQSVLTLHARVKGVTDILKTEFLTILDLELPATLEGDND